MVGDQSRKHLREAAIMRYVNLDENVYTASGGR